MSGFLLSSRQGFASIPLGQAEGKPIKAVHLSHADEALYLDLQFQDDTSLELTFRVEFRASATLLEYKNGDSHVIKKIKPKQAIRV